MPTERRDIIEPSEDQVFAICWAVYEACAFRIAHKRAVINPFGSCKKLWRPDRSPNAAAYVVDFQNCGKRALTGDRYKLFRLYHCQGMRTALVMATLKVQRATFEYWMKQVREAVGQELVLAGVYPIDRYFAEFSGNPESAQPLENKKDLTSLAESA